ncbi:MAG: CHAT domain-containing protein [Devosia nanyangense]|uniref:CHAT domain-containing protein n=1 Tax=Devosia nanyangense TaxID=1228055 RepID=A0A933L6C3_9HYPH|nr:CHAT domain-containing protein [Devosia nanyangense]
MAARVRRRLHHKSLPAAMLACALLGIFVAPVLAGSVDDMAARAAAVETALSDKDAVAAEGLAREALELAEQSAAAATLAAANLNRLLGDALFSQEKFVEAEPYYRRALALREEQLGAGSVDTSISANDLALVLKRQQRFAEAEPYYRQVVAIRETVEGPNHPDTARAAFWLSRILDAQGRFADAAGAMADAVVRAAIAFGENDPTTIEWMGERAAMLHDAGDHAAAEPVYIEAIRSGEAVFEAGDTRLATTRQGLANLYAASGRATEAVPLFRAALAAREAALGADDPATLRSADGLARALWALDAIAEAETLFRRVLAARERSGDTDSAAVADVLRWIGRAAAAGDRRAEAEILFKRALAISESLDPDDVLTAFDLIALGQLYSGQQRFAEARPLLQRAVAIFETSDENRRSAAAGRMALSFLELATGDAPTAITLAERSLEDIAALDGAESRAAADVMLSLAGYRQSTGDDLAEAERLVTAARDIYRTAAPDSRALVRATSALGRIRETQGRLDEALVLHREALDALSARYGSDSAELQSSLADVGSTLFAMGDYVGAAASFEQSVAIVERLAAIDADAAFQSRTGAVEDQAIARAAVFDFLVKSDHRLAAEKPDQAAGYGAQAFLVAQRVIESEAAGALAQMAARQASGNGDLASLVRERQDLVAQWRHEDSALTLALAAPGRDAGAIEALRGTLADADSKIAAIDAQLATAFPDFARLQKPAPATFDDVRARLEENDVLLFFADTNRLGAAGFETYLWAVPKHGEPRWTMLPRASGELSAAVRELRDSMGVGANTRGPTAIAQSAGKDTTSRVLTAAFQLHDALFASIADLIEGKDLVIVPSRSLSALPFHALISALPATGSADRYRDARWLARDHAITILPSVASLAPAGSAAAAAQPDRPAYLAFANPLLVGRGGDDRRAFDRAGCAPAGASEAPIETAALPELSTLFRGAGADVASVRALPPLPETTDEVCAIAGILGAASDALHLGAEATEATVKQLSGAGQLMRPRVVHFATHGLVSGELTGLAEPAIVLTPPEAASPGDDGLLTASEVTTLRLDADWVILSACNTASSDGGGEALSGLARAFFYAGARALMVSHWPVNSDAAVALATGAFAELARDPTIGRAEALRRAMIAEIDRGGSHADPANWAPFILVGASR